MAGIIKYSAEQDAALHQHVATEAKELGINLLDDGLRAVASKRDVRDFAAIIRAVVEKENKERLAALPKSTRSRKAANGEGEKQAETPVDKPTRGKK